MLLFLLDTYYSVLCCAIHLWLNRNENDSGVKIWTLNVKLILTINARIENNPIFYKFMKKNTINTNL